MKKRIHSMILLLAIFAFALNAGMVSAKIKMNAKKVVLTKGDTTQLKMVGTKKKVKWSSANKKVATVNTKGKVKAKKVGKTTIKAKVGSKTYKCTVVVKKIKSSVPVGTTVQESDGEDGWGELILFD